MEPIREGASGVAVEDIQERLTKLDYQIDQAELDARYFGPSTAAAVARFRLDQGLSLAGDIDTPTWSALVDEGYQLGDRTPICVCPSFMEPTYVRCKTRFEHLGLLMWRA